MATMQVAPQQTQSPVGQGTYSIDPPSSRLQFTQQTAQTDTPSQVSHPKGSPHSSSRRPSKRPSGNGSQTITPDMNPQPPYQSPSASGTARGQDMANVTRASPAAPVAAPSPPQQSRRDRTPQLSQGGPPISPPPRTSSNQRGQTINLLSNTSLTDRSVSSRQTTQAYDDRPSSSRTANDPRQGDGREQGASGDRARAEAGDGFSNSTSGAANVARSRRRGPASPDGPQRAISTREPGHQPSPGAVQSRSASNVVSAPPPSRSTRDEAQVINRVVVDDPAIDIRREQERQLESVPGLAVVNNAPGEDVPRSTPRTRQDFSASSSSDRRRKETTFGEYILGQTLGEGEFGKVKLGWKRGGEVQVAIKLIRRETLGQNPSRLPKIYREVSILRGLEHPNIVKLHEMIETQSYIGIILEYASGGELFDYILKNRYLKDHTARKLFAQLVSGVGYLHKKGIVHRDLKLENLLLDRNKNIVITDFGFANTFDPRDELDEEVERNLTDRKYVKEMNLDRVQNGTRRGDLMATSCGSPCYAAPELVVTDSLYTGRKVDVWSCGVILYAMLAGYLPFDDDPANPEGDNINLLYKYITTTPLTFPEYVTPHARDLLRRILVPDPRQRADLFEVARHSWLSDFAHVVAQVTSSTTTVGDIANATVTADPQDIPLLVRSASVREPAKAHSSNLSPVGTLSHQGKIDPEQAGDKAKAPRDPKRRTVQVEYVAPQRQTVRGEPLPSTSSPATEEAAPVADGQSRSRTRAGNDLPQGVPSQYRAGPPTSKPLPQDPSIALGVEQGQIYQSGTSRAQQRPSSSQRDMPPPARPPKDLPRSVSESVGAFGQIPSTSIARPSTGGSMTSTGPGRLPSRGNSYSQPLAPTVATTNAHGRVTQPTPGKQYNISAPISQSESYLEDESIGRPSTQQYNAPTLSMQRNPSKGHKRSNTLGNFFRVGSISGGRSQPQSPGEKRYPPTSMKTPIVSDSPRQSTESRRPSFGFSRKNSNLRQEVDPTRQEKSRRFSLLPATFSFKSFTSTGSGKDAADLRPSSERTQSNTLLQQAPASRGQQRPQTVAYNRGQDVNNNYRQENIPAGFDGPRDRTQDLPVQSRRNEVPSRGMQRNPYNSPQYQSQPELYPPSNLHMQGQSYIGTPTESETSLVRNRRDQPLYPQGFNSYEDEHPSSTVPPGRGVRGPGVLQKNNRRFADAYDQNTEPGSGVGGSHAGTSGAAKRVMDFFRRRGKARTGDERV